MFKVSLLAFYFIFFCGLIQAEESNKRPLPDDKNKKERQIEHQIDVKSSVQRLATEVVAASKQKLSQVSDQLSDSLSKSQDKLRQLVTIAVAARQPILLTPSSDEKLSQKYQISMSIAISGDYGGSSSDDDSKGPSAVSISSEDSSSDDDPSPSSTISEDRSGSTCGGDTTTPPPSYSYDDSSSRQEEEDAAAAKAYQDDEDVKNYNNERSDEEFYRRRREARAEREQQEKIKAELLVTHGYKFQPSAHLTLELENTQRALKKAKGVAARRSTIEWMYNGIGNIFYTDPNIKAEILLQEKISNEKKAWEVKSLQEIEVKEAAAQKLKEEQEAQAKILQEAAEKARIQREEDEKRAAQAREIEREKAVKVEEERVARIAQEIIARQAQERDKAEKEQEKRVAQEKILQEAIVKFKAEQKEKEKSTDFQKDGVKVPGIFAEEVRPVVEGLVASYLINRPAKNGGGGGGGGPDDDDKNKKDKKGGDKKPDNGTGNVSGNLGGAPGATGDHGPQSPAPSRGAFLMLAHQHLLELFREIVMVVAVIKMKKKDSNSLITLYNN